LKALHRRLLRLEETHSTLFAKKGKTIGERILEARAKCRAKQETLHCASTEAAAYSLGAAVQTATDNGA